MFENKEIDKLTPEMGIPERAPDFCQEKRLTCLISELCVLIKRAFLVVLVVPVSNTIYFTVYLFYTLLCKLCTFLCTLLFYLALLVRCLTAFRYLRTCTWIVQ